jgi:thymidylate synthase
MRFVFDNGFPMLTERNLAPAVSERLPVTIWQQAIGEILAFVNGATTLKELENSGCYWWKDWATQDKCKKRGLEAGCLGPGSYGGAFAHFPTKEGGEFNQWKVVLDQAITQPHLRTLFVTNWIPQYIPRGEGYQQKVVVAPCHGLVHLRILEGKLTLHMIQRSADLVVGVPSNMIQYAALAMAIGQVLQLPVREYVHSFSDAHIYVDQIPAVEKMLNRQPRPFPTMRINNEKKDLFDFRREDFQLSNYYPHPGIAGIPVAI